MLNRNKSDNSYIYITFLITNTSIGRMIRFFTRNQYSHVTIAFDDDLKKMYSFARYHINSPISGGFVIEQPGRYLSNKNDVMVKLCKLPVPVEEYERIRQEITYFHENKEEMLYNTLNAALSLLQKSLRIKNTYTCLEFVTYLLQYKDMMSIRELESKLEKYVVYQGSFRNITGWSEAYLEDDYFRRLDVVKVIFETVFHFQKIAVRLVKALVV